MLTLKKSMLAVTLTCMFGGLACAQSLDTDEAKESYSLGASVGSYISNQIYKQTELGAPVQMDLVVQGLIDSLKNQSKMKDEEVLTSLNSRAEKLNKLYQAEVEKILAKNRADSEKFLAENKAKKGVVQTESGLQYEILSEGKGILPREEDIVTVEYVGKLADGKAFEGTDAEKKTQQFVVMSLVPGLKEGLKLMKEGSHFIFAIPAKLAYGEEGAGPIPPETAIVFDVKLVKVEKPGAKSAAGGNPHAGVPGMSGGMGGMGGMPPQGTTPSGQPKKAWPHG